MATKDKMLRVFINSTDYTNIAYKMGIDDQLVTQTFTTSDSLYIGYKKPVRNLFFEVKTPNTVAATLSVKKWTGAEWEEVVIIDETQGFKKSNFVFVDEDTVFPAKNTVNGVEAYWYKINLSANSSTIVFNGINLVFCSEDDLMTLDDTVKRLLPRGRSSHILIQCAARDAILREINNSSMHVYRSIDPLMANPDFVNAEDFTQFDCMHVSELQLASAHWCLWHRYKGMSDADGEDSYSRKAKQNWDLFQKYFKIWNGSKLTLDLNRDGNEDSTESSMSINKGSFTR